MADDLDLDELLAHADRTEAATSQFTSAAGYPTHEPPAYGANQSVTLPGKPYMMLTPDVIRRLVERVRRAEDLLRKVEWKGAMVSTQPTALSLLFLAGR